MHKSKGNAARPFSEEEIVGKYGVKITDMAARGVRAIGFVGGVRKRNPEPSKDQHPVAPTGERRPFR